VYFVCVWCGASLRSNIICPNLSLPRSCVVRGLCFYGAVWVWCPGAMRELWTTCSCSCIESPKRQSKQAERAELSSKTKALHSCTQARCYTNPKALAPPLHTCFTRPPRHTHKRRGGREDGSRGPASTPPTPSRPHKSLHNHGRRPAALSGRGRRSCAEGGDGVQVRWW